MPWKNVTPMEEIIRFVMLAQSDRYSFTELCLQFGISRKTGYKHLARYAAAGAEKRGQVVGYVIDGWGMAGSVGGCQENCGWNLPGRVTM